MTMSVAGNSCLHLRLVILLELRLGLLISLATSAADSCAVEWETQVEVVLLDCFIAAETGYADAGSF